MPNQLQWFDIIFPQITTQNEQLLSKKLWNRTNVEKFIAFIQQNKQSFSNCRIKRKNRVYTKVVQLLGPTFTNSICRKKFNFWLSKFNSIDGIIKNMRRSLYISRRNQKLFYYKQKENEVDVKEYNYNQNLESGVGQNLDNQNSFMVKDGMVLFANNMR